MSNYHHLKLSDRLTIERMYKAGYTYKDIAIAVGCSVRTIYYEIKRGLGTQLNSDLTKREEYLADLAENKYQKNLKKKGQVAKIARDEKLLNYIKYMIIEEGYSPQAIIDEIKIQELKFKVKIKSKNTIYKAIKDGLIEGVSIKSLPMHGKRKRVKTHIVVEENKRISGTSIDERPEEVDNREVFGHWEMDCVEGMKGDKKTLLVLTERKTRYELIQMLKEHTSKEVVRALNRIEKIFKSDFYQIFKTITVDNGHEFTDAKGMEKALYRVGDRTKIYFCHARHPEERGSNENANLLVRRKAPKKTRFDEYITKKYVEDMEWWINTYPRQILDGREALTVFNEELEKIGCRLIC